MENIDSEIGDLPEQVDSSNIDSYAFDIIASLESLGENKYQTFQLFDIREWGRKLDEFDEDRTLDLNGSTWNADVYELFRGVAWAFEYERQDKERVLYWCSESDHTDVIGVASSPEEVVEALEGEYRLSNDFYSFEHIRFPSSTAIFRTQEIEKIGRRQYLMP